MRKTTKIPRILKINKIEGFNIYCAFNTGESRMISFTDLFARWETSKNPLQSQLLDKAVFDKVILHEGTLQWPDIKQKITLSDGKVFEVSFDLDPIVLYEASVLNTK